MFLKKNLLAHRNFVQTRIKVLAAGAGSWFIKVVQGPVKPPNLWPGFMTVSKAFHLYTTEASL